MKNDIFDGLKSFPMEDPSTFRHELFSVPKNSRYNLSWKTRLKRSKIFKWILKKIKKNLHTLLGMIFLFILFLI